MGKGIKFLGIISVFLIYTGGIFYWFEAEKEVRILCSMFGEGQSVEQVRETLDTGNLLNYTVNDKEIMVNSKYTLNSTECKISLSESNMVIASVYSQAFRLEVTAGIVAAVATFLLAGFQLLLAIGLPWGEFAWGGRHRELPLLYRVGSAFSGILLIIGGLSVFSSINIIDLIPSDIFRNVVSLLTVLFMVSVMGNLNSKSEKERKVMIPASIVLFCTYLIVTIPMFG